MPKTDQSVDDPAVDCVRALAVDELMVHVGLISAHDRFQASSGLEAAASIVAEAASAAGLSDVRVDRYPADGITRWWTFQAPLSWTPLTARLEVRVDGAACLEVDHARQPFSIATYSAATAPTGVVAPMVTVAGSARGTDLHGAVAVVRAVDFTRGGFLSDLAAAGAVGFVTDAAATRGPDGSLHPGRIELKPLTQLFGFSVTPDELTLIEHCVEADATAHALVAIGRNAKMPVVSGLLPGANAAEEIWLTAHLCHPRPSANDNASGAAALLGVAATHSRLRRQRACWGTDRAIRFIWGPEFVGLAATLHTHVTHRTHARPPSAVINLDMVGEDQALCGGPFLLERNPDSQVSMIAPIAEHIVDRVFASTGPHPGDWRSVPFMGMSDHALFADPQLGCPAVQLCHAPDRFNHSAADSLDKVSAVEMGRATAAGAALAWVLANDDGLPHPTLEQVIERWSHTEITAARAIAKAHRDTESAAWGERMLDHVRQRTEAMRSLLARGPREETTTAPARSPSPPIDDGSALSCSWFGPINLRAMMAALPVSRRASVAALLQADRRNHGVLLNFAIRADGRRTPQQIIEETSFALRRPLRHATAETLLGALIDSGWVSASTPGPRQGLTS
jgi:hypothetical protein